MSRHSKRVGILTWFHYRNYGTALQLTALYETIKKFGYNPTVINYIPKKVVSLHNRRMTGSKLPLYAPISDKADGKYSHFIERLSFTEKVDTMGQFENLNCMFGAFICGSDQIWAPTSFDDKYFLSFVRNNNRKIAYAPSIGLLKINDTGVKTQMKNLISSFKHLSIRESIGAEIIRNLCGKTAKVVLDPTLLLDRTQWNEITEADISNADGYILCYFLGYNKKSWLHVEKIRRAMDLPVKVIPIFKHDYTHGALYEAVRDVGPREFVSLIKNAKYVCTDSFHGLTFSILYGKQFSVYERFAFKDPMNQNARIHSLLDKLNLNNRLMVHRTNIESCLDEIDWQSVYQELDNERENSFNYLNNALSAATKSVDCSQKTTATLACCGCGACAAVCPTDALNIVQNEIGFFAAELNSERCISCTKCTNTCPMRNSISPVAVHMGELYSFKTYDTSQLLQSSSGAAGYELAKEFSGNGYHVFGCTYDIREVRAKHMMIPSGDISGLHRICGSKYIQSDFHSIIGAIKSSEKAIVFALPCQIAGVLNIIPNEKREDFLFVDLICHGVPTHNLFKKYLAFLERKKRTGKTPDVSFRHKACGWREIYIYVENDCNISLNHQDKDLFFRFFEHGHCYMSACYECPFRATSCADIRLGDYWGNRFKHDNEGVSIVVAYTHRGKKAVKLLTPLGKLQEQMNINDYIKVQQVENYSRPFFYYDLMADIKNVETSLKRIYRKYVKPFDVRRKRSKHEFNKKMKKVMNAITRGVRKGRVYLYGIGQHTEILLSHLDEDYIVGITALLTNDSAVVDARHLEIYSIPIGDVTELRAGDTIIISSSIHQDVIYNRLKHLLKQGIYVVRLYGYC